MMKLVKEVLGQENSLNMMESSFSSISLLSMVN